MATSKEIRFQKLIDNYSIAIFLTWRLIDSGLLENKVKIGQNSDDFSNVARNIAPSFASNLREAERQKESYIFEPRTKRSIAQAYFDELQMRGNEWEYADLRELFYKFLKQAELEIEEEL